MSSISLELHRKGIEGGQLHGVLVLDSPLKNGNMGGPQNKPRMTWKWRLFVQYYVLGEGYRTQAQRFQLSVPTVRNVVRKCKATGKVSVKARSGRQRKISKRQRLRMVRMVKYNLQTTLQRSPWCSWCHCASPSALTHPETVDDVGLRQHAAHLKSLTPV